MFTIILGLHVFICFLLIVAILLQSGKGSDLGSALGGGVASDIFGPGAPANVMNKVTTILAILFMFTSITLTVLSGGRANQSIITKAPSVGDPLNSSTIPDLPVAPTSDN